MWSNDSYAEQPNPGAEVYAPGTAPAPSTSPALVPAPHAAGSVAPTAATRVPAVAPDGAFDVPPTLHERVELCKFLSDANLLPQALRKQPANVLLIMHKALALNMPLSVALEHLHVIDGKVGHSAELLRGLIHRSGHVLRWVEISDKTATGELILRHDPRNPRRESFTIADAQRMKLTNKDNWQKDPASMLVARCTTRLVSRHCPEIAVALGNLSAIDVDDEPPEPPASESDTRSPAAGDETKPHPEQQAADLYAEARSLTKPDGLKAIAQRAREAGLLEVVLPGTEPPISLQQALLHAMNDLTQGARKAAAEQDPSSPPASPPSSPSGRAGGRRTRDTT